MEVEVENEVFFFLPSRRGQSSFYLSSAASAAAMASLMAVHMLMGRSVSIEASDSEEESKGSTAADEEKDAVEEERERRRRRRPVDGARLSVIILSPACSLSLSFCSVSVWRLLFVCRRRIRI